MATQAKINEINLGAQNAIVATSETTTSTTYADLATTTDTVTVTIGVNGLALISIYSHLSGSLTNNAVYVSFAASGTNTIAAADTQCIELQPYAGTAEGSYGATFLLTGLAIGSTTFKMKYRVAGGTGTFSNRRIAAVPL